jgi:hypothetical protein
MRVSFLIGFLLALVFMGCKQEGGGESAPPPAGGQAAAPAGGGGEQGGLLQGFDSKAEIAALQGTWNVRDGLADKSVWEVKDTKVVRKKGDKTEELTLAIPYPGRLAVSKPVGGGGTETEYLGYARSGADVYVGLGKAGAKLGDRYLVAIDGLVIKDPTSCKFFKKDMFGDKFDKTGVEVKCEVKDEGGKQVLLYEAPDPFNKGQMAQSRIQILGDALLDDQMLGNKAEKVQ